MSKEEKKLTISRSYQRTMPHSIFGGEDYASTKLMATYTQELPADADEEERNKLADELHSYAKGDVQEALDEEAKRIVAHSGVSQKQMEYIVSLLSQTGEMIDKPIDELNKDDASKLINRLKKKSDEINKKEKEAKKEKSESTTDEQGNEIPFD